MKTLKIILALLLAAAAIAVSVLSFQALGAPRRW